MAAKYAGAMSKTVCAHWTDQKRSQIWLEVASPWASTAASCLRDRRVEGQYRGGIEALLVGRVRPLPLDGLPGSSLKRPVDCMGTADYVRRLSFSRHRNDAMAK
jgi:hypothetical protein